MMQRRSSTELQGVHYSQGMKAMQEEEESVED